MPSRPLALALSLVLVAGPSVAEDLPPLHRMRIAHDLFEIGLTENDPLYILTAARLRKSVDIQSADRAPEGGAVAEGQPLGWKDMLAAAQLLISQDPVLQGLAEDLAAETSKGVTSGPVYSIVDIRAGGRDRYPGLSFAGGQYAEIYVEGPSGTDLNLQVRDGQGRLVCSDTDISAIAYCGWRPAADDRFEVTVVNHSGPGGRYSMMTN